MAEDKDFTWDTGPSKDDVLLKARDGEAIAHIFPRDGKPGFSLVTKDHGEWWNPKSQHCESLLAAQHHALQHGERYYQQEARNLGQAHQQHLMNDLQNEWQRMGGDKKTLNVFKVEWERVVATEYRVKIVEQEHER